MILPSCPSGGENTDQCFSINNASLAEAMELKPPSANESLKYLYCTQFKNFHRLQAFSLLSLGFSLPSGVLQRSSSILFFCLSTAGNDSVSPPPLRYFLLPSSLLSGGDGRSWCFINSFLLFTLCLHIDKKKKTTVCILF